MEILPYELLVNALKYTSKISLLFKSSKILKHCVSFLDHQVIILKNFDFRDNWDRFNVIAVKNDKHKKITIRKNGTIKNMPKSLLYLHVGHPLNKDFKLQIISLPNNLKYLFLDNYIINTVPYGVTHYICDNYIYNGWDLPSLPQFSETVTHLNTCFYDHNIKKLNTLTHLTIYVIEPPPPLELPVNLKKLKISGNITHPLDKFPISLTHLIINSRNCKLPKWPITLIFLKMSHEFKIFDFPLFLTYLTCASKSIKGLKWPIHLTHLHLYDMVYIRRFPENLECLNVEPLQSSHFNILPFCPSINIQMGFAHSTLKLKNDIKKLDLGLSFPSYRMNVILDSIKKSNITHLIIRGDNTENDVVLWLNDLLNDDMTKLTHLKLTGEYRSEIDKLPKTITHLIFKMGIGTFTKYPPKLKFLSINIMDDYPSFLPNTLKYLSCDSIIRFVLPKSLIYLRTRYRCFNLIPSFVKFVVLI